MTTCPDSTTRPDTLLTLFVPAALEESVIDLLLAAPAPAPGFTTGPADGHGAGVRLESTSECVRGRGRRVRFEIALDAHAVAPLREHLRAGLSGANVFFWTTPLLDCGTLS